MTRAICRRLRRSREVGERAAWLVENHLRHIQAREMRISTLRRLLAEPHITDLLELVRIDGLSASGDLSTWEYCQQRLHELADDARRPEPLLRGRDLIELGHSPGPEFRRILEAAYDAQLEGEVHSNEEARAWASLRFPSEVGSRH